MGLMTDRQVEHRHTSKISKQLKKLGIESNEIKLVILTHLHGDHIGGLKHFSNARFLVSRVEYNYATGSKGKNNGYFPKNWPVGFEPELITYDQIPVGNFSKSHRLKNQENIIIVPTPGHSIGHQSIIIKERREHLSQAFYNISIIQR